MTETIQILEKLNSLYSSAISQIITYTLGVIAFVGILIPVFISFIQSRQLRRDHEGLSREIAAEISTAKGALEK